MSEPLLDLNTDSIPDRYPSRRMFDDGRIQWLISSRMPANHKLLHHSISRISKGNDALGYRCKTTPTIIWGDKEVRILLYALLLSFIISNSFPSMAFAVFGFGSSSSDQKIGYVDVAEILRNSKWGGEIEKEAKRQQEKLRQELDRISKRYKEMRDQFEKKKSVLNDKGRMKQVEDLQMLEREGNELLRKGRSKHAQLQQELMPPLIAKLKEVVRRIAEKDHYDYVMDKAVLIGTASDNDLTSRVLTELNNATPSNPLGSMRAN